MLWEHERRLTNLVVKGRGVRMLLAGSDIQGI